MWRERTTSTTIYFLLVLLCARVTGFVPSSLSIHNFRHHTNIMIARNCDVVRHMENKVYKATSDESNNEANIDQIADMIEVSFVNACMQLAEGYIDTLKLFIAAVKVAFDKQLSIPTLVQMVADCPVQSANRPLSSDEIEVRTVWCNLVYLTLETIHTLEKSNNDDSQSKSTEKGQELSIRSDIRNRYDIMVQNVVREDMDMSLLEEKSEDENGLDSDDLLQAAIRAQAIKVIKLTTTVVNDEKACYGDGLKAPRPPIPGTG